MNDAHPDLLGSPGVRAYERELAMLGHLVTRPELPTLTRLLILDAMLLWTPLAPLPPVTAASPYGTAVGCFLRDVRLLLEIYLDYAPDDHAWQVLGDVHRMLGLAQYSLVDPAGADAGQHRGSNRTTTSPACGPTSSTPLSTSTSPSTAAGTAGSPTSLAHPRSPAPGRAPELPGDGGQAGRVAHGLAPRAITCSDLPDLCGQGSSNACAAIAHARRQKHAEVIARTSRAVPALKPQTHDAPEVADEALGTSTVLPAPWGRALHDSRAREECGRASAGWRPLQPVDPHRLAQVRIVLVDRAGLRFLQQ